MRGLERVKAGGDWRHSGKIADGMIRALVR